MEEDYPEIPEHVRWKQLELLRKGKEYPHSQNMLTPQGQFAYGQARKKRDAPKT